MDDLEEDNYTTISTTTKMEKITVLVCKNCKNKIPFITLLKDETTIKVELTCTACKVRERIRLNDYLEFSKTFDLNQKCETMSTHTSFPASIYCLKCGKWMCSQCFLNHQTYQAKHKMTSSKVPFDTCKEHDKKKLKFNCETCNLRVCKTCTETTHQKHTFKEIIVETIESKPFKAVFDSFKELNEDNKKNKDTLVTIINEKIKYLSQLREDLERSYENNVKNSELLDKFLQIILMNYENFKDLRVPELYSNLIGTFTPNKAKATIDYVKFEESSIDFIKYLNTNFGVQVKTDMISIGYLKAHNNPITCMIQLQDERLVTGSQDNLIKVWNPQEMQCLKILNQHQSKVLALLQLQGGNMLSGSDDKTIKLWDVKDWNCLKTLSNPTVSGHNGSVWGLIELRNKASFISISSDRTFKVWSSTKHILTDTIEEETEILLQLRDQRLVTSGCQDKAIQLWNSSNYGKTERFFGHQNKVNAILELKEYKLVSGSYSEIITWDLNSRAQLNKIRVNLVYTMLQLNDKTLLVGAYNSLLFFDLSSMNLTNTLEGKYNIITNIIELKDRRIAISTWDSTIQLYNF